MGIFHVCRRSSLEEFGSRSAAMRDPAFAAIERHRAAKAAFLSCPPDDSRNPRLGAEIERALQALGHIQPSTSAGAAALLAYTLREEEGFVDENTPLRGVIRAVGCFLTEHS
jgi:hypothetical protein